MTTKQLIKYKISPNHFVAMSKVPLLCYTVEDIFDVVCKAFDVTTKDILSRSRLKRLCDSRRCVVYLAGKYIYPKPILTELSKIINTDHATTFYHIAKIKKLMEDSIIYKNIIDIIELDLVESKLCNVSLIAEGNKS